MNPDAIRHRIEQAFAGDGHDADTCREIAFHLTDWLGDLEALIALFEQPDAVGDEQLRDAIRRFLLHAPNHLAAASKLVLDIPVEDVFCVGATGEGGGRR